ncbi:MAG TPA: GNAT family N-acetyltransferase, partial [Bryobacteraceae bacterium]|nr:GNAT family N-acetyltransferase [Bryobacteraceae bacterium]
MIDRTAELAGKNRTDFVLDAARRAAEDTLLDRTRVYGQRQGVSPVPGAPGCAAEAEQAAAQEHADTLAVGMSVPLSPPEPLGDDHQIDTFDSGEPVLDDWLRRRARANQTNGASRTYVVCEGTRVAAYYALASGAIAQAGAPGRFRRNMPDPIPVVVLARLAVDKNYQGRGLGRALFRDAAQRVANAADTIGIRGIVV